MALGRWAECVLVTESGIIRIIMNDYQSVRPLPPSIIPPVAHGRIKWQWFRPALRLGIAFNALACFPAARLFQYGPYSAIGVSDYDISYFTLPVSVLALLIGIPFAIWQIWKRRRQGQSILWEIFGLLLCFCPYLTGLIAFRVTLNMLSIDVQGHEYIPPGYGG